MTLPQTLAGVLRDLAGRLDPYRSPQPMLPAPGDAITVTIVTAAGTEEFHGVVNVVMGRVADGQGIRRLVVREVEG